MSICQATIGVDHFKKEITLNEDKINLQLWDISGQERFQKMTHIYYKNAIAAIIVYDVTRPDTLNGAIHWKKDVDAKVFLSNGNPIPCFLVANKIDLVNNFVDICNLNIFCREQGFLEWFATSVATNTNIDITMNTIVQRIVENYVDRRIIPSDMFIDESNTTQVIQLPLQIESKKVKKKCVGCDSGKHAQEFAEQVHGSMVN